MLAQRLGLAAATDADHASEPSPPASFDASQSVLEQDSAQRLNPEAARGFQKKRWIRLPRQPEFLRIQSVDTLIDEMIKPCSAQNGGAVLAG